MLSYLQTNWDFLVCTNCKFQSPNTDWSCVQSHWAQMHHQCYKTYYCGKQCCSPCQTQCIGVRVIIMIRVIMMMIMMTTMSAFNQSIKLDLKGGQVGRYIDKTAKCTMIAMMRRRMMIIMTIMMLWWYFCVIFMIEHH